MMSEAPKIPKSNLQPVKNMSNQQTIAQPEHSSTNDKVATNLQANQKTVGNLPANQKAVENLPASQKLVKTATVPELKNVLQVRNSTALPLPKQQTEYLIRNVSASTESSRSTTSKAGEEGELGSGDINEETDYESGDDEDEEYDDSDQEEEEEENNEKKNVKQVDTVSYTKTYNRPRRAVSVQTQNIPLKQTVRTSNSTLDRNIMNNEPSTVPHGQTSTEKEFGSNTDDRDSEKGNESEKPSTWSIDISEGKSVEWSRDIDEHPKRLQNFFQQNQ
jgi:hypothetical protein